MTRRNGARRQTWETPAPLVRRLEQLLGGSFDLDPCAEVATAKAPRFYTVREDGLRRPWFGRVFCNPPFANISPWVVRALDLTGPASAWAPVPVELVVLLVPADRSDRPWWRELRRRERARAAACPHVVRAELGRVPYGGRRSVPFASTLWILGHGFARLERTAADLERHPHPWADHDGTPDLPGVAG